MLTQTTRFCLIRHGETAWNAVRRYQGQIDIDLNALGEQQALALRERLATEHFDAIIASDLKRAWHTAQLACGERAGAVLPGLSFRERHYGVFQGKTVAEASTAHPHAHAKYMARTLDYDFEHGESLIDFAARVMDGFADLAEAYPGKTVAVFTHGGVLDVVYRAAVGRDLQGPRDFSIPNAAINWLSLSADGWQLETWGDRTHLDHLERALDEVSR